MNKKLLFLVPGRLGDALMLTPALALLKQLQPAYGVDVLSTSSLGANVYRNNPHCNQIYIASAIQCFDSFIQPYDFLIAAHRDNKILELSNQLKKPLLMVGPADLGKYQPEQALEFIQSVFSSNTHEFQPMGYQLFPDSNDEDFAARFLDKDKKYLGLHLGCHSVNKKTTLFPWLLNNKQHKKVWPLSRFIQLTRKFKLQHPDFHIVVTGGSNEQYLAKEFKKQVPDVIDLIGQTDILQLAALMKYFKAYVCPDTGTMHMACAMGTPLIALFGPTNVKRTGPYPEQESRRVIKSDNLANLNPDIVLSAINPLVDN